MAGHRLADATWRVVDAVPDTVLLVPVGSTEQHGPHLPLDTDTTIAVAVTERVTRELAAHGLGAWVSPPIGFGSSGEHQDFTGTVSIGTDVLVQLVLQLVRSARTWARRVVLVNAHGGNAVALERAVRQLVAEGHEVSWQPCRVEESDLHAGRTETSLMLHLAPWNVRLERAEAGNTAPLREILPVMVSGGVAAVSPNGVLGDPAGATAAEGAALLTQMVRQIVDAVLADLHGLGSRP